jgi:hypothetical protein
MPFGGAHLSEAILQSKSTSKCQRRLVLSESTTPRRISGYVLWNPVKCGAPGFQRTYPEIRRSLEYIHLTPIEGTHVAFGSLRVVFMPILIFRCPFSEAFDTSGPIERVASPTSTDALLTIAATACCMFDRSRVPQSDLLRCSTGVFRAVRTQCRLWTGCCDIT